MQHLPAFFFRDYGDRFQKFVLLRGPSGQVWPVNLCVSCGSITGRPTVRFSRGWKTFALDHDLQEGDKLIFTLVSFSRFSVQVFDGCGTKKPTASTAISGWAFRREGLVDGVKQRRSFYVNWKEKTVRESALGRDEEPKKGKVVANRHTKTSLLLAHVKGSEKFKMERRTSSSMYRGRNKSCFRPRPFSHGRASQKSTGLESETEQFLEIQDVAKENGDAFDSCLAERLSGNKDESAFPWSSAMPSRCVHQDHEGTTQSPDTTGNIRRDFGTPNASETFSFAQCAVSQRRPGGEQVQTYSDHTGGNACSTRLVDEQEDDPLHVHYKTREKLTSANTSDEMLSDPGAIRDNHLIHDAVPDNSMETDILADVTDLERSSASLSPLHHDPDFKRRETHHIGEAGLGGCSRLRDVKIESGESPADGALSRPPRTNNITQVECNGSTRSEEPIPDAGGAHMSSNRSPDNLSLSYFFNQPRPRPNVTPSSANGGRHGGGSNSVDPMFTTGRDQGEPPSSGVDQIFLGVSTSSSMSSDPNRGKAAAHTASSLGFTDTARILDEQPRTCEKSGGDDCRRVDQRASPRRLPGDAVEKIPPCVSDIHQMDSSGSLSVGAGSLSDTQNFPTSPQSDVSLSHYLDQPAPQEPKAQSSKIFRRSAGLEGCNPLQQRIGVMRGSITKRYQPPPSLKSDNEDHIDLTGGLKTTPSSKICNAPLATKPLSRKGLSHRFGQQMQEQRGVSKNTRGNENSSRNGYNFLENQPPLRKSPTKKLESPVLGIDHAQQLKPAGRMKGQIMRENATVPALYRGNASVHNLKKQGRQVKQRNWKETESPSMRVSEKKVLPLGTEGDGWNTWMDIFRRNAITS